MNAQELKGALEAIIYAADEPATLDQLVNATGAQKDDVRQALEEMIAACAVDERGIEIRRVARGYKYSTKPQHHELVRKFLKSLRPPVRLSMPALETLAVIAYKQPITLPEIQEIRGVNCSGVIQTLLEKHLVTTAGRKPVIGRPILYRTTKEFLVRFGLNDVDELPSLKEFEQMAREALGSEEGIEIVTEETAGSESAETARLEPQPGDTNPETGKPAVGAGGETAGEVAGTELAAAGTAISSEAGIDENGSAGYKIATAMTSTEQMEAGEESEAGSVAEKRPEPPAESKTEEGPSS